MLRPLIKTIISYKYPLIDNPFYENDYLIGSSELAKLILISEKETNRTLEDLEEKIKVLSAVIFGSITERYTKRKCYNFRKKIKRLGRISRNRFLYRQFLLFKLIKIKLDF